MPDIDHTDLAYPRLALLHPRWMDRGACLDAPSTDFFPEDRWGAAKAKEICEDCCVMETCREYALDELIAYGVWGGVTATERRAIWKERGIKVED